MTRLTSAVALAATVLAVTATAGAGDEYKVDASRYGAIAYSKSTGTFGYGWNHSSRGLAERAALSACKGADAKATDAKVVTWVKFGWAVLIVAEDNAFGYDEVHGDGANSGDAYNGALQSLRKSSTAKIKTVVTICSGNVKPKVERK